MTGKVLEILDIISPDMKATRLIDRYVEWEGLRQPWKNECEEVRRYVYATNTMQTTNSQLPWKNKTTVPKLCHIRDNLYSNYTATMFPQRKSVIWEANEQDANSVQKRDAITNYMYWFMSQPHFKSEMDKIIFDYIDYGNCFATVEWLDQRVLLPDGRTQSGYVGPGIRRINPLDIVMNPTAPTFIESPKFVRSVINQGELKALLERMSNDENRAEYEELFAYLKELREKARTQLGDWSATDRIYQMDGFGSYREYLQSDFVEVVTFYGDWYDPYTDTLEKNRVITIVDRHKIIGDRPNASYFGYPPIYHVPWRKRQDNLWGQGPLANLVGMQYRLDHLENMKADIMDLTTYPVIKIKGFVEDFDWSPGSRIFVSEEGDVEMVVPDVQALNANIEIERIMSTMEIMAGAPKEAMGFRTPGEKTKYEVQSLENAAARVFNNKIKQFEEQMAEMLYNAALELARRNMVGTSVIKIFDNNLKVASFETLSVEDITGIGRIRPVAARHFTEQAQLIQNITAMAGSQLWPTVQPHFSGVKLAKLFENFFNLEDYGIVVPYIALAEQADAQKQTQVLEEQLHMASQTATGMGGDFDVPSQPPQQQVSQ